MKLFDASTISVAIVLAATADASYQGSAEQPFISQWAIEGFNYLKYMGGNGPYVDRTSLGISRDPPDGCQVDQVFMIHRHGERMPEPSQQVDFKQVLDKLRKANLPAYGTLGFFQDWKYFVEDEADCGLETWSGPYGGLNGAFQRGAEYRERYGHLWDKQSTVPIFAAGWERVVQTARKFGEGFLHFNYTNSAAVNVILESAEQGADSLTPSCNLPLNAACNATFSNPATTNPYFVRAAERINAEYHGLNLTSHDIYMLQQIAGYELNVRSWSPWLTAFTKEEWVGFQHTSDLVYYYCIGPGSAVSKPIGSVYSNATLQLMKQGPGKVLPMYWSFMHDGNIVADLTALGLTIPVDQDLPWNGTIPFYNQYKSTEIVPMSGHFVLERMSCARTSSDNDKGVYVRGVLNEAVTPFPDCHDGPGFSCRLDKYENDVVKRHYESYTEKCNVPKEYPQYLDFFWNYNTTGELNHGRGIVPYQQGSWGEYNKSEGPGFH